MSEISYLDDICRFCLTNKSSNSGNSLIRIDDKTKMEYEDLTKTEVRPSYSG